MAARGQEHFTLLTVALLLPGSGLREMGGVQNFRQYYGCYFSKYYQHQDPAMDTQHNRDTFVSQLLAQALAAGSAAPCTACVEWMCDERLVWKIWMVGPVEVWGYYSNIGHNIQSWKHCFLNNSTDLGNYQKIISGLFVFLIKFSLVSCITLMDMLLLFGY